MICTNHVSAILLYLIILVKLQDSSPYSQLHSALDVLLIRLYSLWDYRRRVLYILRIAFVLCWVLTTIAVAFTMPPSVHTMKFDNTILHMCTISSIPRYRSIEWAPEIALELFVVLMTVLNAADRPRNIHVKIISDLIRDGIWANLVREYHRESLPPSSLHCTQILLGEC
ncbi:hypothetical protein BC834DRAFT_475080 [Gloeopeniophorella convolvens]|nr:hypothetical protein BC834DRAFT_475080 [Gloeopeniophorella convolvens]